MMHPYCTCDRCGIPINFTIRELEEYETDDDEDWFERTCGLFIGEIEVLRLPPRKFRTRGNEIDPDCVALYLKKLFQKLEAL